MAKFCGTGILLMVLGALGIHVLHVLFLSDVSTVVFILDIVAWVVLVTGAMFTVLGVFIGMRGKDESDTRSSHR